MLNDLWIFDGANWTWIYGSNIINQNASYGTQGIPDINNIPDAREYALSWIDESNNLYFFGGNGRTEDDEGNLEYLFNFLGYLNDIWKYIPFNCFGFSEHDPQVCSRRGKCVSDDKCECKPQFTGSQCEIPLCFDVPANSPNVCSSHGYCVSPDKCECEENWR